MMDLEEENGADLELDKQHYGTKSLHQTNGKKKAACTKEFRPIRHSPCYDS